MKTNSKSQNVACVLTGILLFIADSQAETNQVGACLKSSSPCQEAHSSDNRTQRMPWKPEPLNPASSAWNGLWKTALNTNGIPAKSPLEPVQRNPAVSPTRLNIEAMPGVPAQGPEAPRYSERPIPLIKPQPRVRVGSDELPRDPVTRRPQGWTLLTVRF